MDEQLITLKTARLAKKKKFNNESEYAWLDMGEGEVPYIQHFTSYGNRDALFNINTEHFGYLAPTQSLLQKWLREEHSISIIIPFTCGYSVTFNLIKKDGLCEYPNSAYYDTYEEALENGLALALEKVNLIK